MECLCPLDTTVVRPNKTACLEFTPEIGGSCEISEQCTPLLDFAECAEGACVCLDTAEFDPGSNKCIKKAVQVGDNCADTDECAELGPGLVQCSLAGTCDCIDDVAISHPQKTKCLPLATLIGDHCEITEQCNPNLDLAECSQAGKYFNPITV